MRGRVRLDMTRVERVAVLEGVDRHVLGAVIGEHPPDIRQERDRDQIAEQQREPQHALGDVQGERRGDRGAKEPGEEVRHAHEQRECRDQTEPHRRGACAT